MCLDCCKEVKDNDFATKQWNALFYPNDPIERSETLFSLQMPMKSTPQTYTPIDPTQFKRRHQTLVVVFVKHDPSPLFIERSGRFVTSLNLTETIKADIVSLSDGILYSGLVWTGQKPGGMSQDDIEKFSRDAGYTQTVVLKYNGDNK